MRYNTLLYPEKYRALGLRGQLQEGSGLLLTDSM